MTETKAIRTMAKNAGGQDMQLVVFRIGNEEYGADISQIREIIRPGDITSIPQAPEYVQGIINLRGQVTTIVNLRRKLNMEDRYADGQTRIVIVEAGKSAVGVMVDSVTEVKYVKGSQIEPFAGLLAAGREQDYILGVCKLKDSLLILIDLKKVLEEVVS